MLAKSPHAKTPHMETAEDFAALLQLPPRPDAIDAADAAHRAALDALEAARQRHRSASKTYQSQRPGQPATVTIAEVDELGRALIPLTAAEAETRQACEAVRRDYQACIERALAPPMFEYRQEIADTINHMEALLGVGVALQVASAAGRVNVPGRTLNAALAIAKLVPLMRQMLHSNPA